MTHSGNPVRSNSSRENGVTGSEGDSSLHEAFLDELADIYSAEQQIAKALPKMAKAAHSLELREAFEAHLDETLRQAKRLEDVAANLGETLKRKKCKGMEGLLEEGKEMMDDYKGYPALDAVLISAAQKVEHYEIASYGTLCEWAQQMGHNEAADLLQETLDEEKATDDKLTTIAEDLANQQAQEQE